MSSNSVCNHTRDKQIGVPLRGRPILFITRIITDRIGLHSVLWPLLILSSSQGWRTINWRVRISLSGTWRKWEELGRCLRFNQAAITGFDEDNRGLKKKAFKMLMAWKQRKGSNATYKVLCDALCDKKVQCTLLAEQFCCEWDCKNCLSLILYSKRLSHFYIT